MGGYWELCVYAENFPPCHLYETSSTVQTELGKIFIRNKKVSLSKSFKAKVHIVPGKLLIASPLYL